MRELLPTEIFRAVTDEDFTVEHGCLKFWTWLVKIGAGNSGNFLSHLSLWDRTVNARLILEDDAALPPENAANVMESIAIKKA
jgi:GR25 family glycosyltransferase involved in LPS biosynthesis